MMPVLYVWYIVYYKSKKKQLQKIIGEESRDGNSLLIESTDSESMI